MIVTQKVMSENQLGGSLVWWNSDINISKIKLSASNTATKTTKLTANHTTMKTASTIATKVASTADGPFNWKKMLDKLHKAHSYDKIV